MESFRSLLMTLLTIVVVTIILVDGAETRSRTHPNIVGGSPTTLADFPWQVALLYNGGIHCGGSLISADYVLSAAHCVYNYQKEQMQILMGTDNLNQGGERYSVQTVVIHEKYDSTKYINDISLLKASSSMDLAGTGASVVTLPAPGAARPADGTALRVSGWGQTDDGSLPSQLRMVEIIIQPFQQCSGFQYSNQSMQICAFAPGKDSCFGDSGGPLVYGNVQCGIVSYGSRDVGCGGAASIYTFVTFQRDWITENCGV